MKNSNPTGDRPAQGNSEETVQSQKAHERLQHINHILRATRKINRLITNVENPSELISGACKILVQTRGYQNAWIALLDDRGCLQTLAGEGMGEGFPRLQQKLRKGEQVHCQHIALNQPGVHAITDTYKTCSNCPLSMFYQDRAALFGRMEFNKKLYGTITVSTSKYLASDEEENALFEELSNDLAYALYNMEVETRRKENESALLEKQAELENKVQMLNQVPVLVAHHDLDHRIVWANQAYLKATNRSLEELKGKKCWEAWNLSMSCKNCPVIQTLKSGVARDYILTPANQPHWSDAQGSWLSRSIPLKDPQGKIMGVIETAVDITKRVEDEKNLTRLYSELKTKNKELEQVLYTTSHDLRSPLVNIQGFTRELEASLKELAVLLKDKTFPSDLQQKILPILNEDIPESLKYIITSSEKMDGLLSGLLSLSRLGKQKLTVRKLNMNLLVKEVITEFSYRIKKQGVHLEVSDLAPCKGDKSQISRVFSNLLSNALKFISTDRPGSIKVYSREEKEKVSYFIEDNGVGISPKHQQKIFEIFYKLTPSIPGQGLGLTIVKQILDKHDADIQVESTEGKGTRFILTFPSTRKNLNLHTHEK
jgi:signal transduction histidine kinase